MVNRLCIPPLLQVPPASRGEPFGSFASLLQVPPASRGEPFGSFAPLRGSLREGSLGLLSPSHRLFARGTECGQWLPLPARGT
jgi:hypothetical protein